MGETVWSYGTLGDLEEILSRYGDKPQIVHGVAVAARHIKATYKERALFLISLLGKEYEHLHWDVVIPSEVLEQFLRLWEDAWNSAGLGYTEQYRGLVESGCLSKVIAFLASHDPFEGLKGKIRKFLECPGIKKEGILAQALLRYQMFDELEQLVEDRVYEAIPPLFEAVVEQVKPLGAGSAGWLETLVRSGWRAGVDIGMALMRIGSDARALYLLLDLCTAYVDEHGKPYPIKISQVHIDRYGKPYEHTI